MKDANHARKMVRIREKQKLPKFSGDSLKEPTQHYKICFTLWEKNVKDDHNYWLKGLLDYLMSRLSHWNGFGPF